MKNLRITVNGVAYDVQVEELGESVAPAAPAAPAKAAAPAAKPAAAAAGEPVKSPMPGTILNVPVKVGQSVKAGYRRRACHTELSSGMKGVSSSWQKRRFRSQRPS